MDSPDRYVVIGDHWFAFDHRGLLTGEFSGEEPDFTNPVEVSGEWTKSIIAVLLALESVWAAGN